MDSPFCSCTLLTFCVWVGKLRSGLDSPPGAEEGFAEQRSWGGAHN